MFYWLLGLLIVAILLLITGFVKSRHLKNKKLIEIKEQWGKPKDVYRNFKLIGAYLTAYENGSDIKANTATDLDVDGVFGYIDRTNSKPGQQYLYKKLHSPEIPENHFNVLEQQIAHINSNQTQRELTELKLSELGNNDAYYLPQLFSKTQESFFSPMVKLYIRIAPPLTILFIASLFMVPNQFALIAVFILIIANVIIHYSNKTKMLSYTHSLPQLLILNNVGKWLADNHLFENDEQISKSLTNLARLKKSLSFINLQKKAAVDPTDMA